MKLQRSSKERLSTERLLRGLSIAVVISLLAAGGSSAYARAEANNVSPGIQLSKDLGLADPAMEINITVHMKLNDKAAFDKAVDALQDRTSPTYHKWMTSADLKKYAPSEAQRQAVRTALESHGLTILAADPIGFTIRAHGTIANVESAFNTEIHQFGHNGKLFRANVRNAQLAGEAANYVSTVAGIESHQVHPLSVRSINPVTQKPYPSVPLGKKGAASTLPPTTTTCLTAPQTYVEQNGNSLPVGVYTGTVYSVGGVNCAYLPSQLQTAYGLNAVYAAGLKGAGQTIVLMEGYPTIEQDANAFFKLMGLPQLTASNFSIIYPEGKPPDPGAGVLEGWDIEIALDVQSSHSIAPAAKILVVATNGQDSEDFQFSIDYVANNHLGNAISDSYEEDTDIVAGALEQTSWDEAIEVATAQGISVNFSTGDGGDEGLGTPLGAPGVPSVAPHATAVGGTSILNDVNHPGSTITTSWGDTLSYLAAGGPVDPPEPLGLIGGGGGGQSIFFAKPSWQAKLPGKGRQTPDVSALADPYTGVVIVVTSGGTQYIECCWGGTSLSSPIFTAFWDLASEKVGQPLGQAAPLIAALPYGGVQDVLPTTDSSPNNATAVITDSSGTTDYSAAELFAGVLYGNKGFTSTLWPEATSFILDFGFGIDSSLTVTHGWDNATGYGTPYGLTFINAVAAASAAKK
jgi:subtilase family serine protease